MSPGRVEAVLLGPRAEAEPVRVRTARAVPGRGLEGDRYFAGAGTWSNWRGITAGQDLTLIEAEALEAAARHLGREVTAEMGRRNVVVSGVSLDDLVGRSFRVGEVECHGDRPCDPCRHLERLGGPGLLRALTGRGGLRADVLSEGAIEVGAAVTPFDEGVPGGARDV